MPSAIMIGDYFLACKKHVLTPLHVLKLVYISHGYTLALKKQPLIDEQVEAWRYGPVIPGLYEYLKIFGNRQVTQLSFCQTLLSDEVNLKERKEYLSDALEDYLQILDPVLERYGGLAGWELVDITHRRDTPWARCYIDGQNGAPISNDIIKEHYEYLINVRTGRQDTK